MMVISICEYAKNHWNVFFKQVNSMVGELYLNETAFLKSPLGKFLNNSGV